MSVLTRDDYWKLRLTWAAFLIWSGLIWVANTRPNPVRTQHDALNDLLWQGGHLIGHTVLAVLAWRAMTLAWGHKRGYWVALVVTIIHSVLDEVVQCWVPTRHALFEDIVYNVSGAMLGIILCEVARMRGLLSTRYASPGPPTGRDRLVLLGGWPHATASGGDGQREELNLATDASERPRYRWPDDET